MQEDPEAQARELEAEARGLSWCLQHDSGVVYFDGPAEACPCCALIREQREEAAKVFLALTKDLDNL